MRRKRGNNCARYERYRSDNIANLYTCQCEQEEFIDERETKRGEEGGGGSRR